MYTVHLELEYDEDSGVYTVTSSDVPGLVTEGSTPEEIYKNVQEALEGLLEVWAELDMPIPPALERARSKILKEIDLLIAV